MMEEPNNTPDPKEKATILANVHRISAEQLYNYIREGKVAFKELQATGRFDAAKQATVRKLMEQEEQEEQTAWDQAQAINTKGSYQQFINDFPNGKYTEQAKSKLQQLQREEILRDQASQVALEEIIRNRLSYTRDDIVQRIDNGTISVQELTTHNILPNEVINHIREQPNLEEHIHGWSELPPLEDNRTDLYFFGIPASGKSCLLGGILHYGEQLGNVKIKANNVIGFKYAHDLMGAVRMGYTPPSTPVEGVNYITADFLDDEGKKHPLNIVEMSGEFFDNTYRDATVRGEKSIGASDYLANRNKKLIFLVVDYHTGSGSNQQTFATKQAAKLSLALQLLEQDGTLNNADGIYIILTKSDLLPGGATDLEGATTFIDQNFMSLRTYLRDLKQTRPQLQARIFPFSLGSFYLRDTFRYDPTTSKMIFDEILSASFFEKDKKRRWF